MGSPIDTPPSIAPRRPSLPQNVHSTASIPYASSSQQLRQQQYHALTPPNVSPASYHPSPSSSHDYSSYNGSPVSNGPSGGGIRHDLPRHDLPRHDLPRHDLPRHDLSRHDLPSLQTSQSRLTDLAVDTSHNLAQWHAPPMMTSSVDPIEPFVCFISSTQNPAALRQETEYYHSVVSDCSGEKLDTSFCELFEQHPASCTLRGTRFSL
ncbi:hypothetical protein K439DRAFT_454799 [Ramaria rubella]|nr:hypothetical protein K439DRAFT_454799 [Ramaria rubella]